MFFHLHLISSHLISFRLTYLSNLSLILKSWVGMIIFKMIPVYILFLLFALTVIPLFHSLPSLLPLSKRKVYKELILCFTIIQWSKVCVRSCFLGREVIRKSLLFSRISYPLDWEITSVELELSWHSLLSMGHSSEVGHNYHSEE